MKVLIVEDVAVQGETLRDWLASRGYRADYAANASAALSRMAVHPYDAMVIDVYVPGLDGLELLRRMRSSEAWRDVPVILVTAAADPDAAQIGREMAALQPAVLVRKPYQPEQIAAALAAYFPQR